MNIQSIVAPKSWNEYPSVGIHWFYELGVLEERLYVQGTLLRLGTTSDPRYEIKGVRTWHRGKPAIRFHVYRAGDESKTSLFTSLRTLAPCLDWIREGLI